MSTISNDSQSNLMDHSAIPGRVPQYNRQLKPMKHSVPTKRFAAWMLLPAAIALGISGYLSYASLTSSDIAGCSGGQVFDCGHVLSTKWSKWFGVPVSLSGGYHLHPDGYWCGHDSSNQSTEHRASRFLGHGIDPRDFRRPGCDLVHFGSVLAHGSSSANTA